MTETDTEVMTSSNHIPKATDSVALEELLAQIKSLSERVVSLEAQLAPTAKDAAAAPVTATEAPAAATLAAAAGITQEEVLAISAAIAAWLGVHAHIRQIRLIRTGAWAQQGRVTIQTSHRLNY